MRGENSMKVLLVNGSPNQKGCTYTALCEVGTQLEKAGITADHFWIGNKPIAGCIGCGYCMKHGRCHYDDTVNEFLGLAKDYDGFVFGAPVHFASAAASMIAFMDRVFFVDQFSGAHRFMFKPGAALVSARRAGTTAALEELNKYLLYAQMPIAASRYWNMVHGQNPDEVRQDTEGIQIMRVLGRNMAWLMRNLEAGKKAGIGILEQETRISTNFIG